MSCRNDRPHATETRDAIAWWSNNRGGLHDMLGNVWESAWFRLS